MASHNQLYTTIICNYAVNFVSRHRVNGHPQTSVVETTEQTDTHMILTGHLRSGPLMGAQ